MPAHASPWLTHAQQRIAAGSAKELPAPRRMEWTTCPGHGPGAEVLGPNLRGRRLLELGCGVGHNVAHLAVCHRALVMGVDVVGLQIRRARTHYGRFAGLTFTTGHALHYLQATEQLYDAIYSVFGAIGLVAPGLLLPPIAEHLKPDGVIAFSVPHPRRGGRAPSPDNRPLRDVVTLPDRTQLPVARWEFDTARWGAHLSRAGLTLTSEQELGDPHRSRRPTTLLITASKV